MLRRTEKEMGVVSTPQCPIKRRMGLSKALVPLRRGGAAFKGCVESQESEKAEKGRGGKKGDGRDVCERAVIGAAGTLRAGYRLL